LQIISMGGVQRACQACQWAFDAFNKHIGAAMRPRVLASSTHGQLYPGWMMPDWLAENQGAFDEMMSKADGLGWWFEERDEGRWVLTGKREEGERFNANPEESGSEWEER
jgi:hypothetical protein